MNNEQQETDYYYFTIKVNKAFAYLQYYNALKRSIKKVKKKELDHLMLLKEEELTDKFGGLTSDQFPSFPALGSFLRALADLLKRKSINITYRDELLYLTLFYSNDFEQQSHENNYKNQIQAYTDFLIKFVANCNIHYESLTTNGAYECINDVATNNIVFFKKELKKTKTIEQIITTVPDKALDVFVYFPLDIFGFTLYIPEAYRLTMIDPIEIAKTNEAINLNNKINSYKTISKSSCVTMNRFTSIDLPPQIQREVMISTINNILKFLKEGHAPIYKKAFRIKFNLDGAKEATLDAFLKLFKKRKTAKPSNYRALIALGKLLIDYTSIHSFFSTTEEEASFIFEFFALLKAFPIPEKLSIPKNYMELAHFYTVNKIANPEKVRLMFKPYRATLGNKGFRK